MYVFLIILKYLGICIFIGVVQVFLIDWGIRYSMNQLQRKKREEREKELQEARERRAKQSATGAAAAADAPVIPTPPPKKKTKAEVAQIMRNKREQQIRADIQKAIEQLFINKQKATATNIAKLSGVSRQTIAKHTKKENGIFMLK